MSAQSFPDSESLHKVDQSSSVITSTHALVFLSLWGLFALLVSSTNVLAHAPAQIVPAVIGSPVLVIGIWIARSEGLRRWISTVDLRWFVAYHLIRVPFGIAFLQFYSDGLLPELFATRAGYGDIAAGLLVLPVLALFSRSKVWHSARPLALIIWNVVALADILMVLITAQQIIFGGDPEMTRLFAGTMTHYPMTLTLLIVVPLILLTHGVIFFRLKREWSTL